MSIHDSIFRVAIVGGGIGGLFAALCLHHHCRDRPIRIDVYEQASEYKEIGAGIGLGVNAARLLFKLGIGEQLNSVAGDRKGTWISFRRFDNGDDIVTVPLKVESAIRHAPVARAALLDLLRETVEERNAATLHVRKQCLRVEDLDDKVRLHFSDSTNATADLVIACDGIHSNIRNQFVQDKPIYSGQIAYRALVPISELGEWRYPGYSVAWCAKHRHVLVYPINKNKTLNVVAFITAKEEQVRGVEESWTSVCDRSDVERDFDGFEETVQRVIKLMPERPGKWRLNDREPLEQWHYFAGKVVLLGDAAHAMLPHLGAGTGQAIEDGWVLGRTIRDYLNADNPKHTFTSLEACANHYQAVRRPRAQKVQRKSREAGNSYEMQAEDMIDKSYEECLPLMADRTAKRMKFVWEEDLDEAYDKVRMGECLREV